MTPFMPANSEATHQTTNLNSIHFITSNYNPIKTPNIRQTHSKFLLQMANERQTLLLLLTLALHFTIVTTGVAIGA